MKGYIYTMFRGADPGHGWHMTDPIFSDRPTLGACMPNIRRCVIPGDHIFVVSGSAPGVNQYIVGGFAVDEKISALAAFKRFPDNRQRILGDGKLAGNIIVGPDGRQNRVDYHRNFARRVANYIVGRNPIVLSSEREVAMARRKSLSVLQRIFDQKDATKIGSIVARWRRLEAGQVEDLRNQLLRIKTEAARE